MCYGLGVQTLKTLAGLIAEAWNPPPPKPNLDDPEVRQAWELIALWNLHPGDQHPTKKGWILQRKIGPAGEPMWLKENPPWRVWIGRIALWVWIGGVFAVAVIANLTGL